MVVIGLAMPEIPDLQHYLGDLESKDKASRIRTLSLLKDNALDALISDESGFEELPRVMERLALSGEDSLCHRIRYN